MLFSLRRSFVANAIRLLYFLNKTLSSHNVYLPCRAAGCVPNSASRSFRVQDRWAMRVNERVLARNDAARSRRIFVRQMPAAFAREDDAKTAGRPPRDRGSYRDDAPNLPLARAVVRPGGRVRPAADGLPLLSRVDERRRPTRGDPPAARPGRGTVVGCGTDTGRSTVTGRGRVIDGSRVTGRGRVYGIARAVALHPTPPRAARGTLPCPPRLACLPCCLRFSPDQASSGGVEDGYGDLSDNHRDRT